MPERVWLVCGSRHLDERDRDKVMGRLRTLSARLGAYPDLLMHGDARGADRLGAEWGELYGCDVRPVPADWETHGRAAGPIRNKAMARVLAEHDGLCVAFPLVGEPNKGTWDMVRRAGQVGCQVVVLPVRRD